MSSGDNVGGGGGGDSPRRGRSKAKNDSLFEEEDDNDLFHVLKVTVPAKADAAVHYRQRDR